MAGRNVVVAGRGSLDLLRNYVLPGGPVTATATVDFTAPLAGSAISALSFGSCISTYAGDGVTNIIKGGANATAWKNRLGELGPVVWRIPLWYNAGSPGSSAGGGRSSGDAGTYVTAIKSIGGIPMVAVGGTTGDNDITTADAAALVHYFNDNGGQNGGPVDYWIIGNEPDNSGAVAAYIAAFNGIAAAMRAATTRTLNIAGPSYVEYADYKQGDFNTFLDTCGAQLDRLDFHKYGSGDGLEGNLAATGEYEDAVTWLRGAIAARPATAGRVQVHNGEFNYHPFYDSANYGGAAFYTSRNTVHTASVLGHLLNKGGSGYQYSDNNGPLGLITDGTNQNGQPSGQRLPMPAFHGMKMWTGGNLFRRPSGSMATCTSSVATVEVFASTVERNVVVVNKSAASASVTLNLTGTTSGTYTMWATAAGLDPTNFTGPQWANPTQTVASGTYSASQIPTFTVPGYTTATVVLNPPTSTPDALVDPITDSF